MLPFLLVKKRLVKEKYIILYIRQFFERSSRKLKKEDAYKHGVGQTRFRKNLNGNNGSVNSGDSCYGQQVLLLLQQGYAACFLISVSALMTGWLGT